MKKGILLFMLAVSVTSFMFSQESSEMPEETSMSYDSGLRTGLFFTAQSALGDLNEFEGFHAGGGIQVEYDLGLPLPSFVKVGTCGKVMFNKVFLKDDILLSAWNMQMAPGAYVRFEFFDGVVAIQPGVNYGLQLNFLTRNPKYENNIKKFYLDQFFEYSVGFRYSPAGISNGALELGITPFYILCPEKNNIAHYAGGNIFVFYRF